MRKPIPKRKRERWVLEAVARFVAKYGWWPSAPDLGRFTGYGSRESWLEMLRCGIDYGVLERHGKRTGLTVKGYEVIGWPVMVARMPARRWCKRIRPEERAAARAERRRLDTLRSLELRSGETMMVGGEELSIDS